MKSLGSIVMGSDIAHRNDTPLILRRQRRQRTKLMLIYGSSNCGSQIVGYLRCFDLIVGVAATPSPPFPAVGLEGVVRGVTCGLAS